MRGEEDGGPVPVHVPQHGEDHLGALHIETARGFIQEEECWFMEQRHGKDEPLLHALGVCLDLLVLALKETKHGEQIG